MKGDVMKRKPVSPDTDALARRHAMYDIEHSTEPVADRARFHRLQAQLNVQAHQYQWAGLWRRVAEIPEEFAVRRSPLSGDARS